jgi:hypothetical protein
MTAAQQGARVPSPLRVIDERTLQLAHGPGGGAQTFTFDRVFGPQEVGSFTSSSCLAWLMQPPQ